jgi:hypothetical protein
LFKINGRTYHDKGYGFHLEDNILDKAALRLNDSHGVKPEHFTWGRNYFLDEKYPRDPTATYPRELAAKAGPEEPYRSLLLGNE